MYNKRHTFPFPQENVLALFIAAHKENECNARTKLEWLITENRVILQNETLFVHETRTPIHGYFRSRNQDKWMILSKKSIDQSMLQSD